MRQWEKERERERDRNRNRQTAERQREKERGTLERKKKNETSGDACRYALRQTWLGNRGTWKPAAPHVHTQNGLA